MITLYFIVAGVLGFTAGAAWGDAMRKWEKDEHARIAAYLTAEIKQLRMQVANIIGGKS